MGNREIREYKVKDKYQDKLALVKSHHVTVASSHINLTYSPLTFAIETRGNSVKSCDNHQLTVGNYELSNDRAMD